NCGIAAGETHGSGEKFHRESSDSEPRSLRTLSQGQIFLEQTDRRGLAKSDRVFQSSGREGPKLRACLRRPGRFVSTPSELCEHFIERGSSSGASRRQEGARAGRFFSGSACFPWLTCYHRTRSRPCDKRIGASGAAKAELRNRPSLVFIEPDDTRAV